MTIIEARELAIQGKTVICPAGEEWVASDFTDKDWCHPTQNQVFGEWREKREPRRFYKIEVNGTLFEPNYFSKEGIKLDEGERIVEFVEVVSEKP